MKRLLALAASALALSAPALAQDVTITNARWCWAMAAPRSKAAPWW
jgi:opacity protein-like surface antigen